VQDQVALYTKTPKQAQADLGIGAGGDPIKPIDIAAENAIVDTLREHKISCTFISEESGVKELGENPQEYYVTTDPIDGTTNLTRGVPFCATSIAVSTKAKLERIGAALVADLYHNTVYTAQKGKGAYRDGKRIAPSQSTSLREALIGLDLNTTKAQELVPQLVNFVQNTEHIRHLGANALELCYVADGTTDAFVDIRGKLRSTDMAAAWLIIEEAGGVMTTPDGEMVDIELSPRQKVGLVASANQKLHKTILNLIRIEKERK
jgi:myo-inositol-1(or 4)-monophosphatase